MLSWKTLFLLSNLCLLTACGTLRFPGEVSREVFSETIQNTYFTSEKPQIFLFKLLFKDNQQSGIFVHKKAGDDLHRVVISSLFGGTLLDLTFDKENYTVNYVVEDLNKKFLLNLLHRDFSLLVNERYLPTQKIQTLTQTIYQSQQNYLVMEAGKLQQIQLIKGKKKKVQIDYTSDNGVLQHATLKHFNLPVSIELDLKTENE